MASEEFSGIIGGGSTMITITDTDAGGPLDAFAEIAGNQFLALATMVSLGAGDDVDIVVNANGGADHVDLVGLSGLGFNSITVSGGRGNDTIIGSEDDDLLHGDEGADVISGNGGNDTINGGERSRSHCLAVRDGDDRLDGEDGGDTLDGGAGDDILNAGTVQ